MNSLVLYIDPGTGSMLFSILIGAAATLFFLAKALFLKLKIIFSGGSAGSHPDKSFRKYVIYCEDKRYWTVFKPVLDEFERRKTEVTYFVSSPDDPVFSAGYKYIRSEAIGEGNKAYAKLNFLSAGIVLMTTPGLHVYQFKRSKNVRHYSHIFHSVTDATMYRLFGIDYFDSVLLTGDYQAENIRLLEKMRGLPQKELVTTGCTYLDTLSQRMKEIPDEENHEFTVLVSPSWGKSALLSLYGEKLLDPLSESGFKVIIRPHPQSSISEKEMLESLQKKYEGRSNVSWDFERDNIFSLKKADILISDFSGIVYDYAFLCDKPVMYATAEIDLKPYDAYDIGTELWQFSTLKKIGIEIKESDFPRIKEVIQTASDSDALKKARQEAKAQAWQNIGCAGKLAAEFMIRTAGSEP